MVTVKLICVFVFACAKSRFSHNEAHFISLYFVKKEFVIYGKQKLALFNVLKFDMLSKKASAEVCVNVYFYYYQFVFKLQNCVF